jgi:hypothetical protein
MNSNGILIAPCPVSKRKNLFGGSRGYFGNVHIILTFSLPRRRPSPCAPAPRIEHDDDRHRLCQRPLSERVGAVEGRNAPAITGTKLDAHGKDGFGDHRTTRAITAS